MPAFCRRRQSWRSGTHPIGRGGACPAHDPPRNRRGAACCAPVGGEELERGGAACCAPVGGEELERGGAASSAPTDSIFPSDLQMSATPAGRISSGERL